MSRRGTRAARAAAATGIGWTKQREAELALVALAAQCTAAAATFAPVVDALQQLRAYALVVGERIRQEFADTRDILNR